MLFDDYANGQWMPVNMFFDVCTDDVFKGGSDAGDQPFILGVAEFRASPSVAPTTGWWDIFYAGLKRCNGALEAMDNAVDVQPELLARLRAEILLCRSRIGTPIRPISFDVDRLAAKLSVCRNADLLYLFSLAYLIHPIPAAAPCVRSPRTRGAFCYANA